MAKKQKFPHLLGSKWTAQRKTLGWRHFRVVNRKNEGALVFAELVAACDAEARFWLNAKALKNKDLWAAGWQTLSEIQAIAPDYEGTDQLEDIVVEATQRPAEQKTR